MANTYTLTKNGCTLTIGYEAGKVYPKAFGKVTKNLEKGMKELNGITMKPEQALNLLKNNF